MHQSFLVVEMNRDGSQKMMDRKEGRRKEKVATRARALANPIRWSENVGTEKRCGGKHTSFHAFPRSKTPRMLSMQENRRSNVMESNPSEPTLVSNAQALSKHLKSSFPPTFSPRTHLPHEVSIASPSPSPSSCPFSSARFAPSTALTIPSNAPTSSPLPLCPSKFPSTPSLVSTPLFSRILLA